LTAETLSAIASVGTFIVIAVTAFAALVQLRHIRAGNQLAGLINHVARWESDALQSAADFVETKLPAKMKDPEFLDSLWVRTPDRRIHQELRVADWCEQMGSYIKYGMISEAQYLDLGAFYVASMWDQLRDVIAIRRAATGTNSMFENFEFLAARAKAFNAAHPAGNYPPHVQHLLLEEEWRKLHDPRTMATGAKTHAEPNYNEQS
jgi:hypothetical protein